MTLAIPASAHAVRSRAAAFGGERLLPSDPAPGCCAPTQHDHAEPRAEAGGEVRARGLWCPQMPSARGGQGLGPTGMALVYEELGRSRFGPVACNCAAPDDGNMLVLERVGTEAQKERWLQPIVDGRVRS